MSRPRPIITGPRSPTLTSLSEAKIGLVVRGAGMYRLAVRWSPYWHTSLGCLAKGRDGMLRLTIRRAHFVRLRFHVNAGRALDELAGVQPTCKLPQR